MNKLVSVVVAALFAAVSMSAFAASHTGAPMNDDKKMDKKTDQKKAAKKMDKKDKMGKMDKMDKK